MMNKFSCERENWPRVSHTAYQDKETSCTRFIINVNDQILWSPVGKVKV